MVLEELGLEDISLLDGERLDSTLNLDGDGSGRSPGGEMVRTADGGLTGMLREDAATPVREALADHMRTPQIAELIAARAGH